MSLTPLGKELFETDMRISLHMRNKNSNQRKISHHFVLFKIWILVYFTFNNKYTHIDTIKGKTESNIILGIIILNGHITTSKDGQTTYPHVSVVTTPIPRSYSLQQTETITNINTRGISKVGVTIPLNRYICSPYIFDSGNTREKGLERI